MNLKQTLIEISNDKPVAKAVYKAVEQKTILSLCPTGGSFCESLCWKLWPDLLREKECPCNKPPEEREMYARFIHDAYALDKPLEAESYSIGDVFALDNSGDKYVLARCSSNLITLICFTNGNRWFDSDECITKTVKGSVVPLSVLKECANGRSVKYLGRVDSVSIKQN